MSIFQPGYSQGSRRSGGGKIKLIIAAIIIIAGVARYYSSTQVNPVTGEKQRVGMNFEQEKVLGLQAAPEMAREMGGVVPANGDHGITFPATVLWRFRVAAGAVQVGLWATVAISFGYFSQRALEGAAAANRDRASAAV